MRCYRDASSLRISEFISGKTDTREQKQKRYTYLVINNSTNPKLTNKDFDTHRKRLRYRVGMSLGRKRESAFIFTTFAILYLSL